MSRRVTSESRRSLGRRGSLSLEMAIVASAFFLMLLGSAEIGRFFFVSESIKYVVGEVARAAIVDPVAVNAWGTAQKANYIQSKSGILKYADFQTFNVVVEKQAAPTPTTIRVTALYPYRFSLRWLPTSTIPISNDIRLQVVVP
jgi:Flp pilus assembly protein TadG